MPRQPSQIIPIRPIFIQDPTQASVGPIEKDFFVLPVSSNINGNLISETSNFNLDLYKSKPNNFVEISEIILKDVCTDENTQDCIPITDFARFKIILSGDDVNFFALVNNKIYFDVISSDLLSSYRITVSAFSFGYSKRIDKTLLVSIISESCDYTTTLPVVTTPAPVYNVPTNILLSNPSINENEDIGTLVGIFSTEDADFGDTFTYSFVGVYDNSSFSINGNELLSAVIFDYETQNQYTIKVRSTDSHGLYFDKEFVVDITDVKDSGPTAITLSNSSIMENNAIGQVIGQFTTYDAQYNTSYFDYTLDASDAGQFEIVGSELKAKVSFNYESFQSENPGFWIRVTSTNRVKPEEFITDDFFISVLNQNEAPSSTLLSNLSVDENSSIGTIVGEFSSNDPDSNDTIFTYSLVAGAGDDDNSSFTISSNVLYTGGVFDYETKSSYKIRVRTTDTGGLSRDDQFIITINNVSDQTPTNITLSSNILPYAQFISGNTVGSLSTTDPDVGDTFTYTITGGTHQSYFEIDGNLLKVSSQAIQNIGNFVVEITSTDQTNRFFAKTFTIQVVSPNALLSRNNTYILHILDEPAVEGAVYYQADSPYATNSWGFDCIRSNSDSWTDMGFGHLFTNGNPPDRIKHLVYEVRNIDGYDVDADYKIWPEAYYNAGGNVCGSAPENVNNSIRPEVTDGVPDGGELNDLCVNILSIFNDVIWPSLEYLNNISVHEGVTNRKAVMILSIRLSDSNLQNAVTQKIQEYIDIMKNIDGGDDLILLFNPAIRFCDIGFVESHVDMLFNDANAPPTSIAEFDAHRDRWLNINTMYELFFDRIDYTYNFGYTSDPLVYTQECSSNIIDVDCSDPELTFYGRAVDGITPLSIENSTLYVDELVYVGWSPTDEINNSIEGRQRYISAEDTQYYDFASLPIEGKTIYNIWATITCNGSTPQINITSEALKNAYDTCADSTVRYEWTNDILTSKVSELNGTEWVETGYRYRGAYPTGDPTITIVAPASEGCTEPTPKTNFRISFDYSGDSIPCNILIEPE